MISILRWSALAASVVVAASAATVPPPSFTDPQRRAKLATAYADVDRIFREFAERAHVPGAAWGLVIDGELAHAGGFGVRDLDARAPVDQDTVFRIASMTKSFTAMSIVKLRDEGKLSLDDLAERYLPELKALKYPTSDSPRITIRHLLSHSEGFPEDNPWGDRQLADTDEQMSAMIRAGIPFSNAPGIAYEYSNFGFAILGRIVSAASGEPYENYVTSNILRPLGMTATTLHVSKVPPNRLAIGYQWNDPGAGFIRGTGAAGWERVPMLSHGSFGAMGGMLTSIRDLSKYVAAFLAAWPPRDDAETLPIRRASLREMQQSWRPSAARVMRDTNGAMQLNVGSYAFGLNVTQTCDFRVMIAHGGGLPGFGSTMRWLPEYGVGVIAFGNLTYAGWTPAATSVFDRLLKTGGLQPRMPHPSADLVAARDAVSKLVVQWDDPAAERIAADNLFLDRTKERRRAEIDALRSQVGMCSMPERFDTVENALRGDWTMACERGKLHVAITLAPTTPPTVQYLSVRRAPEQPVRASTCP
jgi:CubicO group peptidase (beta-lactamase class C family)